MSNIELIDSDLIVSDINTPRLGVQLQKSYIKNTVIRNSNFILSGDLKDSDINNVPKGSRIANAVNCKLIINYSEAIKNYHNTILDINLINCLPDSELIIEGNPIIIGTITVIGKVTIKDFAVVKGDVRLENCTIGGYAEITDSHIPFNVNKVEKVVSNLLLDSPQFIGDKYTLVKEEDSNLFRLKALKDFGQVSKGDFGGRVSGLYNLSQTGNCWISYNSTVENYSRITGDLVLPDECNFRGRVNVEDCNISGNLRLCGVMNLLRCDISSKDSTIYGRLDISDMEIKSKGISYVNSSKIGKSESMFVEIDANGLSVKSKSDWYNYVGTD